MGLLEMLRRVAWVFITLLRRVAWWYITLVVPVVVSMLMVLLGRAMLNQVPAFRASDNRPRPEIGRETPATQTDLPTFLDDPESHARARAGLEEIESLPLMKEEPCSICYDPMRADGDVKTLACRHEVNLQILFMHRLRLFPGKIHYPSDSRHNCEL